MNQAVCVDQDHRAIKVIRANARALGVESQVQIIKANIFSALDQMNVPFDLVYIDPPYQKEQNVKLLETLDRLDLVCEEGMVVVESLSTQAFRKRLVILSKNAKKYIEIQRSLISKGDKEMKKACFCGTFDPVTQGPFGSHSKSNSSF